jgi:phage terminase large subunit-like protein
MIRAAEIYIADVLSGKIALSATTRLTFERHAADLLVAPENGWYFDKKAAERVFDFCGLLNHYSDKGWFPFMPEPWQAAIIYVLFGWKKKNGNRRFNYAYIEIPKKNGKTTFASVIANYFLLFDGEPRAQVYCAATAEKQAHICFDTASQMIVNSPKIYKSQSLGISVLTNNISVRATYSKMEPIGRDSKTIEGVNPHCAVFDEYHVFTEENNLVFKNIKSATVNRKQPMILIITTAGFEKDLPCFAFRNLSIDILKGIKKQANIFSVIYTIDDDDWKDKKSWIKANPNWGVSVLPERFEEEFISATNSRTDEVTFKTKNLNLWVDAPTVWIPDEKWMECTHGIKYEDLAGQECYAGIDLASHIDIIALALFFPNVKGHPALRLFFWIPEDKVKEKEDRVDYAVWAKQGWITIMPGSIIDVDQVSSDVLRHLTEYKVKGFAYDPYMAHHGVIQNIQKGGFPVDQLDLYAQSLKNMSAPTKEFEKIISSGELEHFNNPVMRWMMRNVVILVDTNENIKPDKKRSREKIDGPIAAITAIGEYLTLTTGTSDKIIYNHGHSLRTI